jgi:hypothetical protein
MAVSQANHNHHRLSRHGQLKLLAVAVQPSGRQTVISYACHDLRKGLNARAQDR